MAELLEQHVPYVRLNKGLTTNYPATFNGPVTFAGGTSTAIVAIGTGASVTLPVSSGTQTLTPVQNMTVNATTLVNGQSVTIVVTTSGTTSYAITWGTNFKSQGTLSTGAVSGKVFTIEFKCDGVNYNEIARTTAM